MDNWISIEERLPERFQPVIVHRKNGVVEQGLRDVNDWWKVYGTRTKNVTHWMSLPKAPGGVKTHYDRIRSMSIDELAEYMYHYWDAPFCKNKPQCAQLLDAPGGIPEESCIQCARKWLMQEVEE